MSEKTFWKSLNSNQTYFKSTEPFSSCTAHRLNAEMRLNLVSECAQHGQKPSIYELSIYQIWNHLVAAHLLWPACGPWCWLGISRPVGPGTPLSLASHWHCLAGSVIISAQRVPSYLHLVCKPGPAGPASQATVILLAIWNNIIGLLILQYHNVTIY